MTDTGIIFVMRIFWAVFMALMLIGGYRGSCNVENGKASPMRVRTDDSLVWLDPIVFPIVIGIMTLIMCLFLDGEMLAEQFFSYIFDTFFFLNVYFLFLLLSLRCSGNIMRQKCVQHFGWFRFFSIISPISFISCHRANRSWSVTSPKK